MKLSRITIYPIKSLDGCERSSARVTPAGTLEHDRAYAFFDAEGRVANGKRGARLQTIRCEFDEACTEVTLWTREAPERRTFSLTEPTALNAWMSAYLGQPVFLRFNGETGFPDDTADGPTLISEASLRTVAGWFPGLALAETRRRFRANLDISGAPAFWEDGLLDLAEGDRFQVGAVAFQPVKPCVRCAVPSRDPDTGEATPDFQKIFRVRREAEFPTWAPAARFPHHYFLALHARISADQAGRELRVGDEVVE